MFDHRLQVLPNDHPFAFSQSGITKHVAILRIHPRLRFISRVGIYMLGQDGVEPILKTVEAECMTTGETAPCRLSRNLGSRADATHV